MSTLFENTQEHRQTIGDVEIFARIGGSGPPLLLIHGFPQTHAMWHRIAPGLMEHFTCVMPDLRGYGYSSCPPNDAANVSYSKRAMADDLVYLMKELGHSRFAVVGHDRGARVAYRMALDHQEVVKCLSVLDIVPTLDMWDGMNMALAMKTYHWMFLAQPYPLPEMLIERAPIAYLDHTITSWTKSKDLSAFDDSALAEYRLHFATPEHIHATCNDYRAGATFDLSADITDRAAGKKITCPTHVLWGDDGIPVHNKTLVDVTDPLSVWREWCLVVDGHGIDSGHFVAEENPDATLSSLMLFLKTHAN